MPKISSVISVCSKDGVHGRLQRCIDWWVSIHAPDFVLRIIRYGYFLCFTSLPPPFHAKNSPSAFRHSQFVTDELSSLLHAGAIESVAVESVHIVSPLGVVPKKNGKLRLILDLRFLNLFLADQHFALEDLRVIPGLFAPGCFFFTFDLKSGYHHISVASEHRKYLGFSWNMAGSTQYFVFAALPFGLKSAPFVFTKVLRPLVARWRNKGMRIFMYLDDGTAGAGSETQAHSWAAVVRADLSSAGFVINEEKSNFHPRQRAVVLGYVVDSVDNLVLVSPERVARFKSLLLSVLGLSVETSVPARTLAKITGSLSSMWLAFGCIVRLQTRALHACVSQHVHESWNVSVPLDIAAREELSFWEKCFDVFHGQPIWPASPRILEVVFSDASDSGWGGFCLRNGVEIARGEWPWSVQSTSSTLRELLAARYSLASLVSLISNKVVCLKTDNQNVVSVLANGSRLPHLHEQAIAVFKFCRVHRIRLLAQWIPRSVNVTADYLSRILDDDDWQMAPPLFQYFDQKWGPHTVDRFASHLSRQVSRFNALWWSPGAEGVDCFTQHWEGECNWCLPPPKLLCNLHNFLSTVACHATVIFPDWPAAPWWPLWMPNGLPCHLVVDSETFYPSHGSFQHMSRSSCLFGPAAPAFAFHAVCVCSVSGCNRHKH